MVLLWVRVRIRQSHNIRRYNVTLYLQLDDMLVSSRSVCIFNMGSCNVGLCKEDILGVTVPLHQGASSLNTRDSIAAQYNTHITQHCQCWWLLTRPKPNSQYLRNCLRRFFRRFRYIVQYQMMFFIYFLLFCSVFSFCFV